MLNTYHWINTESEALPGDPLPETARILFQHVSVDTSKVRIHGSCIPRQLLCRFDVWHEIDTLIDTLIIRILRFLRIIGEILEILGESSWDDAGNTRNFAFLFYISSTLFCMTFFLQFFHLFFFLFFCCARRHSEPWIGLLSSVAILVLFSLSLLSPSSLLLFSLNP